jgi:hypothetical protein
MHETGHDTCVPTEKKASYVTDTRSNANLSRIECVRMP